MAASDWSGRALGNYRLLSLVGRGGMGAVYAGAHRYFDEPVAVKVLHAEFALRADTAQRFFQEATAARSIQHPNIVRVLDFGEDDHEGALYLVMELLAGRTLASALAAGATIDEASAARIGAAIADGLAAAHDRGVIHRDLKPANVFLTTGRRVKVIDFGVAKLRDGRREETGAGQVFGTPAYMAPEQVVRQHRMGPCTDIYALGALLYRMVVGQPPFVATADRDVLSQHLADAPPPPTERAAISAALGALILACLEKEPEARPASMRAVRDRLRALAGATPRAASTARLVDAAPGQPGAQIAAQAGAATAGGTAGQAEAQTDAQADAQIEAQTDAVTEEWSLLETTPMAHEALTPPTRAALLTTISGADETTTTASVGEVRSAPPGPRPVAAAGPSTRARWAIALAGAATLVLGSAVVALLMPANPPSTAPGAANDRSTLPAHASPRPTPSTPASPLDEVVLRTVPPGALITIDGRSRGLTPATLSLRLPVELALSLPGHLPVRRLVRGPGALTLHLTRRPAPRPAPGPAPTPHRESLD